MNKEDWRDEAITDKQMKHLRGMGHEPDPLMGRGDAAELIDLLHDDPRAQEIRHYHMDLKDGATFFDVERGMGLTQVEYDQIQLETWEKRMVDDARRLGLADPPFAQNVDLRRKAARVELRELKGEVSVAGLDVVAQLFKGVAFFIFLYLVVKWVFS